MKAQQTLGNLSIIVPARNESATLVKTLQQLQAIRTDGVQVIVVDGMSDDETIKLAKPLADIVVMNPPGRAAQMNRGAELADHEILLFLHADTVLPDDFLVHILNAIKHTEWGWFNVRLSGSHWMFRVIEFMMNQRSCLSSVATGDQAIFVTKDLFSRVGGFPMIELMEDIALSKSLRHQSRGFCIKTHVITSSRRWESYGIWKTIWMMWSLRLQYFFGASPSHLNHIYRKSDHD